MITKLNLNKVRVNSYNNNNDEGKKKEKNYYKVNNYRNLLNQFILDLFKY